MEMTKDSALKILEITHENYTIEEILKQYKHLSLEWYPDKHSNHPVALHNFQLISQALLTFIVKNIPVERSALSLEEMLSLFQNVFFGNEKVEVNANEDDDFDGDEDSFDEFNVPWDDQDSVKMDTLYQNIGKKGINEQKDSKPSESAEKMAEAAQQELINAEEREKQKAIKKKAQKKKRKERKKQEKNALKSENGQKDKKSGKVQSSPEKSKDTSSTESEEEIDPESAFVAVIAKKNKNYIKKDNETKNQQDNEFKSSSQSRALRARQLALRGNDLAGLSHYQEAVQLFSEAIKLDPSDFRFFGNRSYCHERCGNFDRALNDAEKSITIAPSVPKGYFRKGKALSGLKRFADAEKCFQQVLKLDKSCDDAVKELLLVRLSQIMDMGFTKEQAEHALNSHNSVESALEFLIHSSNSNAAASNIKKDIDLFLSDDEDETLAQYSKSSASASTDIKMDPSNPEGFNTIWVGNLQPSVSEKMVNSLFVKYGPIMSIKFTPEKFYAFVNYKNKSSAGNAMRALQGIELCGAHLLIRYPHTKTAANCFTVKPEVSESSKPKTFYTPVNGDECYFWRTQAACIHGNNCRYKHVAAHKGIDKKKATQK